MNSQCFTTDELDVLGGTVIVITVEKSPETNYLLNNKQAYIRHGGTNMKMTPQEIATRTPAPHWLGG